MKIINFFLFIACIILVNLIIFSLVLGAWILTLFLLGLFAMCYTAFKMDTKVTPKVYTVNLNINNEESSKFTLEDDYGNTFNLGGGFDRN